MRNNESSLNPLFLKINNKQNPNLQNLIGSTLDVNQYMTQNHIINSTQNSTNTNNNQNISKNNNNLKTAISNNISNIVPKKTFPIIRDSMESLFEKLKSTH